MTGIEREVRELAILLKRLRKEDTGFRVFGACSHRYKVGPTLPKNEIHEFERKHQLALPKDFRIYLELIGNGNGLPWSERTGPWIRAGAGPWCGLYPLTETVNGDRVSQNFPFKEKIILPYEPPYDTWEENVPGLLEIAHHGCEGTTHLVVQGIAYGSVWDGYDYDNFVPTGLSFCEWYRQCLEKALTMVIRERVVNEIKLGMTKSEVIKICGNEWKEFQWTEQLRHIHFPNLVTVFEIDQNDHVIRIIAHTIVFRMNRNL